MAIKHLLKAAHDAMNRGDSAMVRGEFSLAASSFAVAARHFDRLSHIAPHACGVVDMGKVARNKAALATRGVA